MKKILILLSLILAGCVPVTGAETAPLRDDPNIQLAIAGAQLTGTAQAWSMQQVAWTVTAQSWTPTPSVTPSVTPSPTLTFTPTLDVTGTMAVEYMNSEIKELQRAEARKDATNTVFAWLPYIVLGLAIGLASFFGYIGAKRLAMMPAPIHDRTGKPMPMVNVIDGAVVDPDRMTNGAGVLTRGWVKTLPEVTAARQDAVTAMAQSVDLASRTQVRSDALKRILTSSLSGNETAAALPAPKVEINTSTYVPRPAWDVARAWDGKGGLPYGVHAGGLGLMDLTRNPHTAVFGETGSGKSRRFLRPLIAFALAAGHRVVILGKQVDFLPFVGHPNVTIVPVRELTLGSEAVKYAEFLKAMVDEMGRRDEWLTSVHKSTWQQAGREQMLIVFDEYTNAMDLMPREFSESARRYTRGGLREGRKYGFSLVLSAQRAVGLREESTQLGRAVFHVKDATESRYALGQEGAEELRDGYFIARLDAMHTTASFEPTDEEIVSFLAERRVTQLEPLPWLEGRMIEPTETAPQLAKPKNDIEALAESIRSEWKPDMSKRSVAKLIGKEYAGSWASVVDKLVTYLNSNQNLEGAM